MLETAADTGPDSIAAKLQRIRAVVSQSQEEAEEDEMFEDEHADAFTPSMDTTAFEEEDGASPDPEAVLQEAAQEFEAADDEHGDDDADQAVASDDDDDDIAQFLTQFEEDEDASAVTDADAEVETSSDDRDADAVIAEDAQVDDDDASDDALGLDTLAAIMAEEDDQPLSDEDKADNIFDDSAADEQVEDASDDAAMPRARVIKVKRADIDAAIASGALEEVKDDATADTSLSPEDEAELLAELAEVEAELSPVDTAAADHDDTQDAAAETGTEDAVKDDDVQRLMDEADHQMEEPEGSRRRNAFQHLKAAVMAKKADAAIGENEQEDEGAFRSDLASVVQPRRPSTAGTPHDQRPSDRPAPLKLVAEQRVDTDAAPKGPVRPRRVAATENEAAPVESGSFADYAADMGAHDLPALLEAAASYLSFVEGRDEFSRPQLMTKVRQVEQGDFSREDGLRSFGQLLRAGKIEKIKGGRFAVTGDIGYRPDQREAG